MLLQDQQDASRHSTVAHKPGEPSRLPNRDGATVTGGEFEGSIKDKNGNWSGLPPVGNIDAVTSDEGRKRLPYFEINHDVRGEPLSSSDRVTAGFSSWHTGGCQMVLGNGTVRFMSENIDATIYTNLMRRSDGVTLGEF